MPIIFCFRRRPLESGLKLLIVMAAFDSSPHWIQCHSSDESLSYPGNGPALYPGYLSSSQLLADVLSIWLEAACGKCGHRTNNSNEFQSTAAEALG